jgi:hypothetical protein
MDDGGRNSSSELLLRTVRSGRGSTLHSRAQTNTRSCQGDAQGRGEGTGVVTEVTEGRCLPEMSKLAIDSGGVVGFGSSGMAVEKI